MKKILRSAFLGTTVGAIGLVACDAAPPPNAGVSPPIAATEIAPGETLAEIVQDKDAYSRARRLGALLPTLGPELVPAVKQTLDDQRLDLGGTEIELLVRYWATQEPEAASRWALLNANTTYRGAAISTALRVWAEADPQAATTIAWPWSDEYSEISGEVQRELVRGWFAKEDSPELRQFIREREEGISRQRGIAAYVRAKIQTQGTQALLDWAAGLPEGDPVYKLSVYRQVIGVVERFDHEAALRWCETHCDGPYGNSVRTIIAGRWQLRDGAAALEWLSKAPAGHETNVAILSAFALWARREREAALSWMAAHAPGGPTGELAPWLRPLIPVYALLLAEDSPTSAIQWAEQIKADADRQWVLVQAARAWRQVDEDAAEAWLLQSSLSEEDREKARSTGRKPRRMSAEPRPNGNAPEAVDEGK